MLANFGFLVMLDNQLFHKDRSCQVCIALTRLVVLGYGHDDCEDTR